MPIPLFYRNYVIIKMADMKTNYIYSYTELGKNDVAKVGGKNASLGEMFNQLKKSGINIPDGFATTSDAFLFFLQENKLKQPLENLFSQLDKKEFTNLSSIGEQERALVKNAKMPQKLTDEIIIAYEALCAANGREVEVAVRSSATAEDLPTASFAGQHDSFLNIKGKEDVIKAVQNCFASLYNNRAIKYRCDNGFEQMKVLLSAGVQIMVRSDLSSAGVIFTLEPESGFRDVIVILGVWGVGENIVQGAVTPDEFHVFKTTLQQNKYAIISKKRGTK